MASDLAKLVIAIQLVTSVYCITTASVEPSEDVDKADLKGEQGLRGAQEDFDDLEQQETGWIFSPFQEKAKQLEYVTNKVLYPLTALKTPFTSTGSYPVYSTTGGGSYSYGGGYYPGYNYPAQYKTNYYNPISKLAPPSPKTWYDKNYYSSGLYQKNSVTYAADCIYPSTNKPTTSFIPSTPTYSAGTPLNYYYYNTAPTTSYGSPQYNDAARTSLKIGSGPVATPYSLSYQPLQVPFKTYALKYYSTPQNLNDGSQSSGPSSIPALPFPSAPSPPSWSGAIGSLPSPPSIPSLPGNPSTPSLPSWITSTVSPPSSSQTPAPTTSSSPQWSSVTSNFPTPAPPQLPSTLSPPSWASFSGPQTSNLTPIPVLLKQNDETPVQEVAINPPTVKSQGSYVTTLPLQIPKAAISEVSSLYNPSSTYAVSYYPNVFFITNEQHLEKPTSSGSTGGTDSQDDSGDSSSGISTGTSTESDQSNPSLKSQPAIQVQNQPGLTTFYSSNTIDQRRIPVIYSPGNVVPATSGVLLSSSLSPGIYSTPINGEGNDYISSSQFQQTVPLVRAAVGSYPLPIGYSYGAPSQGFAGGSLSTSFTKASAPC